MFMSLVKGNTLNILFSHTTDLQKKKMTNSKLVFYKKKKTAIVTTTRGRERLGPGRKMGNILGC